MRSPDRPSSAGDLASLSADQDSEGADLDSTAADRESEGAHDALEARGHDAAAGGRLATNDDHVDVTDDCTRHAPVLSHQTASDDPMPSEPITVDRASGLANARLESRAGGLDTLAANLTP